MSPNFKNILVEPIETFRFEDEDSLVVRALACVASVSVWFGSKQRGTRIKDRAKNGVSFFGSCFISRAVKTENALPRSFFAPKPNRKLATKAMRARKPASFLRETW